MHSTLLGFAFLLLASLPNAIAGGFCYDPEDPHGCPCIKELCYDECIPRLDSPDPNCHSGYILTKCDCGFSCTCIFPPAHCTPNDSRYWDPEEGLGVYYGEDQPNDGLDNNCDGFIDDEQCNGIDDDKDGLTDEDVGSCLGKLLFVPFCWAAGDSRSFKDRVDEQLAVFYHALDLDACTSSFNHVWLDPSAVNAQCPQPGLDCQEDLMGKVLAAVDQAGINKGDYNEIVGVTNHDICGSIGGQHSGRGYFWIEALEADGTFAHEFGHLYGLAEEYSSVEANGCYNTHYDINALDPNLGCDPKGACCKCTSCDPCCAGNMNREGTGRCMMSSSTDPLVGYCSRCFNQITNPSNKRRYPAFPQGVVALKCGEKNPVGPENIGELSLSLTENGTLRQVSLADTYQGRPSFGSYYGDGPYRLELYKHVENTNRQLFATNFELGGFSCDGGGCVTEGQAYFMRWKAVLPPDVAVTAADVLTVFFKYTPTTGDPVSSRTTINGQAPSAYAGPYQFVECKDGGGTATLSASGSYDPDGDTLQYAWSATGITFAHPTGVTTTADFPLGTTTVTLTVKDGSVDANGFPLQDTDTIDVTVRDTTPPVLTPPPATKVFTCKSPNIGKATAVDACGGSEVTITNDAPATFPLGDTTVTWTATDAAGNAVAGTQRVGAILGDDSSCCPAGTNIIIGTPGNDDLIGTFRSDCILGRGGNDTLNGKKGNDFLSGGAGNDTIVGDGPTDSAADYLASGLGRDNLNAGKGTDTCVVDTTDNVVNCEKLIYY